MTESDAEVIGVLEQHGLLPADRQAIFLSGSLVRGWGNDTSHLDVYVVSNELPDEAVDKEGKPGGPRWQVSFYVGKRRWDVEFWAEELLLDLLATVSWAALESGSSMGHSLSQHELAFLQRITYARSLEGEEWVAKFTESITSSAVRTMIAAQFLDALDRRTEDAVGMLAAGDGESAVLVAHAAVGCAVDAFLATRGEFSEQPTWRARRMRLVAPPDLDPDEYWEFETLADLSRAGASQWVRRALLYCQRVTDQVELMDSARTEGQPELGLVERIDVG